MPCPQNSRTTLNPWLSACFWMAAPMSPSAVPGRTTSMPFHMHS